MVLTSGWSMEEQGEEKLLALWGFKREWAGPGVYDLKHWQSHSGGFGGI